MYVYKSWQRNIGLDRQQANVYEERLNEVLRSVRELQQGLTAALEAADYIDGAIISDSPIGRSMLKTKRAADNIPIISEKYDRVLSYLEQSAYEVVNIKKAMDQMLAVLQQRQNPAYYIEDDYYDDEY